MLLDVERSDITVATGFRAHRRQPDSTALAAARTDDWLCWAISVSEGVTRGREDPVSGEVGCQLPLSGCSRR